MLLLEWYDYRIHRGVAKIARQNGWQLNCPKNLTANEGILKDWNGDGCITLLENDQTLGYLRQLKIPLVDLGLRQHRLKVPRVITDNESIGKLAGEHFRDFGHREVFALNPGKKGMYIERLAGLSKYLKADGGRIHVLESSEDIKHEVIDELKTIASGRGYALEEMSIGFFAYQDTMASEMISLCLRHELRVPENVAVLGVDNDDLINSGLTMGLSSVDSDQEGLGAKAANLLQTLLDDPAKSNSTKIYRHKPIGVVARRSTDCFAVRNSLVANALHWIQKNYYRGIQATDVAEAVGVTQQGLQKAFANSYSRSPGQEIRHQRVQAVAHLLSTTDAKLVDIAANCGYYSVNSLINSFRSTFKTTPGKFRQQKRIEHGKSKHST
ncbi:MAG: Xylose operon regulatory protein [Opitutia bacterium UBA7350]|nr:MAG: Xylose operon regulatory protein [Opitutae bacterium UBA7350]